MARVMNEIFDFEDWVGGGGGCDNLLLQHYFQSLDFSKYTHIQIPD